jgi:hypothetical protein
MTSASLYLAFFHDHFFSSARMARLGTDVTQQVRVPTDEVERNGTSPLTNVSPTFQRKRHRQR